MKIQKTHVVVMVVVLVIVVVVILATTLPQSGASSTTTTTTLTLPQRLNASLCPPHYGSPRPLVVVSLDGFPPHYLQRNLTPTLAMLARRGVTAPYLLPVYPTKTFTNHYSIVTGLYPETHGIVDNTFYDPTFRALFTLNSPAVTNGSWWGGEPIWNTLAKQGKRSATFFWPGSEAAVQGRHPSSWVPYNQSVPFLRRVNQVLEWVSLPSKTRPSWVSLYFEEPDKQGHSTGPKSSEVDDRLLQVEEAIVALVQGLAHRDLLHCVNLMVVSDHGMAQSRPDAEIDLATSVPNISQLAHVLYGASPKIMLKKPKAGLELDLVKRLSQDFKGKLRALLKVDLPKRLHYFNNPRISPIILDLTPGYSVADVRPNTKKRPPSQGQHGYDYIYRNMDAIFIGYGADLVQGQTVEPFQNIELYNLMCLLTGVEPSSNNGTWGALHHLLAHPPPLQPSTQPVDPILRQYPEDMNNTFQPAEGCETKSGWTAKKREDAPPTNPFDNLPWGPLGTSGEEAAPLILLQHNTHTTGYSMGRKVPLWTTFTVHPNATPTPTPTPTPWLADPRLHPSEAPTCTQYDLASLTLTPLFPPHYSSPQVPEEAYYITNAIATTTITTTTTTTMADRWKYLVGPLVEGWVEAEQGPLNVVVGPVFDHDHDGLADPLGGGGPPGGGTKAELSLHVPSDLFAVMTRCLDKVTSLTRCDPARLDALAFVYPLTQHAWEDAEEEDAVNFPVKYSARVRDVELLTNLTLFYKLTPDVRLPLVLRFHRSLWPLP